MKGTKRYENTGGFWRRAYRKLQQLLAEPSDSKHAKRRPRLAPLQELEDRCLLSATPGIHVVGNSFLASVDNKVVRVNSLTGSVIASYTTGVANDGSTFGPDGSLYVADYVNNRVLHYDPTGAFVSSFGAGKLSNPQGLTFGPDGNLYVTNVNNTVQKFSPAGTFLSTFITAGSGGLSNAKAIVWGPDGNAYVSSYFNSEVIRYNGSTGAVMNVFATGSGGFEDLTFGPDQNLYVASFGDNAIYRYRGTDGASLGAFVSGGNLVNPYGLRFDPAGNLDVTCRPLGEIQTYNGTTGAFIQNLATGLANPAYLTSTNSLVTSETGASANFRVALNSQPTADVTITLTSNMPAQGALSNSTLTFTTTNWNIAQVVAVTGLDDHMVNGDQTYQINGIAASADANYNGMAIKPVTVVNKEADTAAIAVTNTSLITSELGTSDSFGVALTSKPVAAVTINLAMSMAGQGSLSQSSLTFNASNWNAVQTVTVTGLDDHLLNGTQTYQITGMATSTDANYSGKSMPAVTVVNQPADYAGFVVTKSSLATSETGTSATFGVALTAIPAAPVTLNLVNGNPGQGSLSKTALTFNAGNWNTLQTVTVTGLDDHLVNGNQIYQITGSSTSADDNFNGLDINPITVTNTEADVAGFAVTPTSLTTSESGASASFSVALTSKPQGLVTINLISMNPGQGSLSKSSLTFNAGNWNVAQSVTVTPLDDHIVNGDQTYQVTGTATSTDAVYQGLAMTPVTVVNKEADVAGFTVTPTSLTTSETGTSASFSVALTSKPNAPVAVNLANSVAGQGSLSTLSLTFTAADWNVAQNVTVTAKDDHIVNGDQTYQVTGTAISTDANYNTRAMTPVTVVNKEADVAGFSVTSTSLTTSETGTSASFSVALTSKPIAPVTINLSSTNPGQGSLSTSSLTFTSGNWNVAQSVTVTAKDDHIVNGDQTYQVMGTATSTDANYNGRVMTPVTVVNKEADVAGFSVTPTSLTTSESGTSASFSVALTSKPIAPVTITLSSTNPGQGSLSQASLTFNAGNWNAAQTVTVTGLNDFIVNGNQTYQINGTAASVDANYNGKAMAPVTVVNKEISTADFVVTPESLTTSESGTSANFSVALNSISLAPVTLNLTMSIPGQGTLSQSSLTFTFLNWNVPQTVTVTGLSDQIVNGNQTYQINGAATSLDLAYNGLAMDPVTVVNQEADTAGISVSTASLTTSETGTAASFGVALTSKPISPVTINLATSVAGQGSLSASSLTFDAANWNVVQNVTVTGLDDQIVNGNQTYQITGTAASLDAVYNGLAMAPVTVVNQEADTAGFLVSTASLTTSETGTAASFTVALTSKPTAPVTIDLATSVPDQGCLSTYSLTFDASNWNVAQSVTVTGLDDQIVNGNQTYQITGAASSADAAYDPLAITPITVVNQESDTAGFSVSPVALATSETGTAAAFTVALTSKPIAPVTINLATSAPGQGTLSQSSLTFDASNWDDAQSVTVTGLDDQIVNGNQTYQITGTATSTDAVYNGMTMTPVTVVNQEADVASIKVTSTSLITSEAGGSASFGVSLASQPLGPVTVNLTSTNPKEGLIPQSVLTFDASNWDVSQTVTVTGIAGETGPGDNDVLYQIQGSASSADGNYNAAVMPTVSVLNKEIDLSGITVTAKSLTTTEGGAADTFHVRLADQPTVNVTINLANTNPGQGMLSQSSLTFTPADWNVFQAVTVTPQDDHIVNGNVTYKITGSAVSADVDYNGLAMANVNVVNKEADVAAINVTPVTGLVINAGGGTASFNISLTSKPSANVTIPVASSNPLEGGLSQSVVTFTPADWNTPQTVTVNAKSVPAGSGDVTVNVSLGSALSADANFVGKIASVSVTVQAPAQVPPTNSTTVLGLLAAPPTTNVSAATVSNSITNGPDNSISTANSPVSGRTQPLTVLAPSGHAYDPLSTLATNAPIQLSLGSPNRAIQAFAPIPRVAWQESASVQVVTVAPAERDPAFETIPSYAPTVQAAQLRIRVAPTDFVLDVLNDAGERIPWDEGAQESTTMFTTGLVATTGYVLLNTRIGVWLLSLLTSQPLWRQFDPLEVLYAWEGESEQAEHETEDEETLVSLVN